MKLIRNGHEFDVDKRTFPVQPGDIFEIEPELWVVCTSAQADEKRVNNVSVSVLYDNRAPDLSDPDIAPPVRLALKVMARAFGVKYR